MSCRAVSVCTNHTGNSKVNKISFYRCPRNDACRYWENNYYKLRGPHERVVLRLDMVRTKAIFIRPDVKIKSWARVQSIYIFTTHDVACTKIYKNRSIRPGSIFTKSSNYSKRTIKIILKNTTYIFMGHFAMPL